MNKIIVGLWALVVVGFVYVEFVHDPCKPSQFVYVAPAPAPAPQSHVYQRAIYARIQEIETNNMPPTYVRLP